ncbi:hypothetical protein ABIB26_003697 [Arthrobacter sp. UYEF20]
MTANDKSELPKLGGPAARALADAGIASISDVRRYSLDDIAHLHGVGPKAVRLLQQALDKEDP